MASEQEIDATLAERLTANLAAVQYDGPQQFIAGELIPTLIEMLKDILSGCFNASGKLDRVKKVSSYQKMKLKKLLIRDVYDGEARQYKSRQGDKVREALVKTIEESPDDEQDILLNYVEEEEQKWTPTNYRWN